MKRYCIMSYRHLQKQLQQCSASGRGMHQKVECCFVISYHYWNQIKLRLKQHRFRNEQQEIEFFRTLKPLFTSGIEYYCLLYHSILFEPFDRGPAMEFWKREYNRLQEFETVHKDFLSCHANNDGTMMPFYFLRKHYPEKTAADTRMYDDTGTITNGDGLVATWMALKKYMDYVTLKMKEDGLA